MKERVVLILVTGIMLLLLIIVVGDFHIAMEDSRPINENIIHLLQVTITGLVAIVGTYFGMNNNKDK